jgi:hypothetical protein
MTDIKSNEQVYFEWLHLEAARYNELYDRRLTEPEIQADGDYARYKSMRIRYEILVDEKEQG